MRKTIVALLLLSLPFLPCHASLAVFSSVKDMVKERNIKEGDALMTLGYWNVNDGGGGTYVVKQSGTQNGGDIIKLNNGLYAHLIYDGRTFNLKQWGISGDVKMRYVFDIYPFLTEKDIKAINEEFNKKTTAETYIIQYLIDKKPGNTTIVLDGNAYYISNTIHLRSYKAIRGTKQFSKDRFGGRIQMPGNTDAMTAYTSGVMMMITPNMHLFDTGSETIQNITLSNFSASGVMGKNGLGKKYSGDFFHQTSVISKAMFENLAIFNFNNGFYKTKEWIWSEFESLLVANVRYNGIYLPSDDKAQVNCNSIRFCRFTKCGVDYDNRGELQIVQMKKPSQNRGNCIVLGGSGNTVLDCDLSHSPVGLFLQNYSNGTTVVGTYCEGASISTYYMDYDENKANLDTEIHGGYISKKIKSKTTKKDFR